MLGAAVPARCSFSRTAGRSLIRMVRVGASAGAAAVDGAECSAGGAGGCCPFTWAARSFGEGPARWRGLALVWWGGGLSPSGADAGASAGLAASGTSLGRSLIRLSGLRSEWGRSWVSSSSTAQLPAPSI